VKNKVISFGAKTVVKWSTMPMIDQGPFLSFARNCHPTFHGSQKEHATPKVARVKGPRKTERKGATNKI